MCDTQLIKQPRKSLRTVMLVAAVRINALTSTTLGHCGFYTCCICKVVTVPTAEGHLAAEGEAAAQATTSGIKG